MLRIKLPAGRITTAQLRTIGELSNAHGRGAGELSTRQTIQLHYLELASLPDGVRRTRRPSADDRRRVRRRRPQRHRLPRRGDRPRRAVRRHTGDRRHDDVLLRQPRLLEPAAQAQDLDLGLRASLQRARDQLHLARSARSTTVVRDSASSSAAGSPPCRGSRASSACSSERDEALPVLRAILDAWQEDLRYRVSRVKARIKFMVDDIGPEGMRAEVERRLGRALARLHAPPPPRADTDHLGVQPEHDGRLLGRVPVHVGLVSGDQMIALADLTDALRRRRPGHAPAELRASPASATEQLDAASRRLDGLGLRRSTPTASAAARSPAPASRTATSRSPRRRRASDTLIEGLEHALRQRRRRAPAAPRRLPPRLRPALGRRHRLPGHDRRATPRASATRPTTIFLRGALGPSPAIGRPAVPARADRRARRHRGGLIAGWLDARAPTARASAAFCDRVDRRRAGRLCGREPARRAARRRTTKSQTRGSDEHVELLDELEAGELSVEFEGQEPWELLEWALERVRRPARDLDRVPGGRRRPDRHGLRDRPDDPRVLDRHGPPAAGDVRPDRAAARALPGPAGSSCSRPTPRQVQRLVDRHGPNLFRHSVEQRLLCCNVRKVQPLTRRARRPRRLGHRPPPRPVGVTHPTSARSRSTTTTARS